MSDDYGKKIGMAFDCIYRLHNDIAKLLQDCDGTIGKGKASIFGNVVTKDLSQSVNNPGGWMPADLYRYYDSSQDYPGVVDGLTIYFWDDPPLYDEPLVVLGQIKYHVEEGTSVRSVCKEWDLWHAYFKWGKNPHPGEIIAYRLDAQEEGRTEWFKLYALPLFSIKSMEDVEQAMSKVQKAQVP